MLEEHADRMTENHGGEAAPGSGRIDRDEVVAPPAREEYRHPAFLERTAAAAEVAAYDELLTRLWSENDRHAGETTLEVQALYSATGAADDLDEGFRLWFDHYLRRRADLGRLNPQVRNDPCLLRQGVMQEVSQLISPLATKPGTLNSVFLNNSIAYARWLTLDRLVRPSVTEADGGWFLTNYPADPAVAQDVLAEYVEVSSAAGRFRRTVERLAEATTPAAVPPSDDELRVRIGGLATEIQQMRPFLGGLRRPENAVVRFGTGLWGCWSYTAWRGGVFGYVIAAGTADGATRAHHARSGEYYAGVNGQGLLCSYYYPWEQVAGVASPAMPRPLAVNHAVLAAVHGKLFETFDKVDLDRVRRRPGSPPGQQADPDTAIEFSVLDLAEEEPARGGEKGPAGRPAATPHIPALRFSRLCRVLEDQLGCDVRGGKGSEVMVYRDGGGGIYTFGRHKADFVVHPARIRPMLRRLAISPAEWLDAVYSRGWRTLTAE